MNSDTIQKAFANVSTKIPKHLIDPCLALANKLNITNSNVDVLTDEWEVYAMKHGNVGMNKENFNSFLQSPGIVQLLSQAGCGGSNENNDTSNNVSSLSSSAVKVKQEKNNAALLSTVTPSPKKRLRLLEEGAAESAKSLKTDDGTSTNDAIKIKNEPYASTSSTFMKNLVKVRPSAMGGTKFVDRKGSGTVVASYSGLSMADKGGSNQQEARRAPVKVSQKNFTSTNVLKPYRYGFMPIETKAKALDEHILELQESMLEHLHDVIDEDFVESIGVPCQENVICFGRICTDAHEGKINSHSILLEGSRHASSGKRVQLDLSQLKEEYSLFPGQIVAVEGINPSGRKMIVSKIYDGVALPKKTSKFDSLLSNGFSQDEAKPVDDKSTGSSPLRIVVASGPFTTSDNLEYEPFRELVSNVLMTSDSNAAPDVVILTGPFVDLLHPKVAAGDVTLPLEDGTSMAVTPEILFTNRIVALIETLLEEESTSNIGRERQHDTQFILVPSIDDVLSSQIFPQAPLVNDRYSMMDTLTSASTTPSKTSSTGATGKVLDGYEVGTLGLDAIEEAGRNNMLMDDGVNGGRRKGTATSSSKRVHLVSNPCTIQINEVVLGITSTDILQHVSRDETNANLKEKRLLKISKHLLKQQCYYPLFPSTNANVPIDYAHRTQMLMPCTPDVLIIPSLLNPFCDVVDCGNSSSSQKCLVMNPGWLTKGTTGGTFAAMSIYPLKKEALEETLKKNADSSDDAEGTAAQREVEHYIHERSEIKIIKI